MSNVDVIKEKDTVELAKDFFDLDFPFTEEELNKSFRRVVKLLRPDLNRNRERFIHVQRARDRLRCFIKLFKKTSQKEKLDQIKFSLSRTGPESKGSKIDIHI